MKEQIPAQLGNDPLELAISDLFDRLAELGSKTRNHMNGHEYSSTTSPFTWDTG